MNVEHKEYTGKSQGNFNSVGAAAGIASFLGIDAGDVLRNGRGGCRGGGGDSTAMQAVLAENAQLKAERYSDNKADALKDNLLRDWLKPLSDRAAEQMAKESKMQAEIDCLKQTTELKLKLAQKEIELARQEAKCCCDKTNMRVDCLEAKINGITKTVIPAIVPEGSARWFFVFAGIDKVQALIEQYAPQFIAMTADGKVDMEALEYNMATAFAVQPTLKLTIPQLPQLSAFGMGETTVSFTKEDADSLLTYLKGSTTTTQVTL